MDEKHRIILRCHRHELLRDLELNKLLPNLTEVLDSADEGEVDRLTRKDGIAKLLDILPRKGPAAFDNFVKALQLSQPFLAKTLLQESDASRTSGSTEITRGLELNTTPHIGNQTCSRCHDLEKELEALKSTNTEFSQSIEQLNKEKEKLIKEKNALQSKSNNFVIRVFSPSGKDFPNCSGVICALKRDGTKPIATRSSDGPGDASDIFNHRISTTSGTKETRGSWWCIDLGKNHLLGITHYALRHGKSDGESILRHWQLEGSNDEISWIKLETSERDNPNDPPQFRDPYPFVTGTWSVEDKVGVFRFFRILQTGMNSSNKYGIYLSGVELYGIILYV